MQCPRCIKLNSDQPPSEPRSLRFILAGKYLRKHDQTWIQRYKCLICNKNFSDNTYHPCKYQKKPHLNLPVFEHLVSGVSQRRMASLLKTNRKTIVRKFMFLGQWALWNLRQNQHIPNRLISTIVFDDMETFESTKFKPLSISLAVEDKTRFILGFRIAEMPAKGVLAKRALEKYGKRLDQRKKMRQELFNQLKLVVTQSVVIKSDQNPHYASDVLRYFPEGEHLTYKGRRGCVVGQGELKAGGFDPLYALNHTAAMLRANVNRLFRRTWNTTKKAMCLEWHMALYTWYHNFVLLKS